MKKIKNLYELNIKNDEKFLKLFGLEYNIEKIFNIEKVLIKYTQTKVERRDPNILNNPRKYSQLIKRYKSFPLEKLFKFLNI